ncbi:hypothetical protein Cgig2_025350 [Carnegiea gigantea]|uniref:Uncharacterized protein n=1 Tax=Carnegiea gigantea TaxID=171969 RepID=A0A9Q1JEF2_9CARY|nr:hypothetical protein Cgig2_025350 [Carnegiea gigantea]
MDGPGAAVHNCVNYKAHQCHHKTVLAAAYYELLELPQAIFYAMLLNEAEKMGVLHGPRLWSLEVALRRPLPGAGGVRRAHLVLFLRTSMCCAHTFHWPTAAVKSGLPEIVQAMFYATLLSDMLELGAVHEYTIEKMRSVLVDLGWSAFEAWLRVFLHPQPRGGGYVPLGDHHSQLCAHLPSSQDGEDEVYSAYPVSRRAAGQGHNSHFPEPKAIAKLKRSALEKPYLLPAEYAFVIPELDATVNEPPAKCIAVYQAALNYSVCFPLHSVIREILNKYELAPAPIVPTSWHNICSFIVTCELRGLTYSTRAFGLVHTVQKAPKETGDLGWYCFNNRPGFMMDIEKKSKLKYWKYDFLFLRRESGYGDALDWNEGKPVRSPFWEPIVEEQRTARYFMFYIREDDRPRPIPRFMTQAIESVKGPEKRRSKSSDREPLN